jgi:CheY-like chemotaxis protein
VFDTFRQADGATTRKFGGLGLGLSIVRHIVELHGGTVKAESLGEEQGAMFTICLPLLTTDANLRFDNPLSGSAPNLQGLKVLVVDDEADSRELIAFILEEAGAKVAQAASADEALHVLDQDPSDLLLSDIAMPETDGYALIRQIRSRSPQQGGKMLAIALTAYAGEVDYQQALAAGFQEHLPKPVEPQQLIKAIARLFSKSSV